MNPLLLNLDWKTKGDEQRAALAAAFLKIEPVEYGAIVGINLDAHHFSNAWTLVLQQGNKTHIEQVRFGENKNPEHYGPGLPRLDEEYDASWHLTIHSEMGIQFVNHLRKRGAWDAIDEPVEVVPYLDGQHAFIITKHPNMPFCSSQSFTGAIYESGAKGMELMSCITEFTEQTPLQIKKRSLFNRIRSVIGSKPKYGR